MESPILISQLNDFIFCPYSIYLHNIYMESDEASYHAKPQTQGKIAHEATDHKQVSSLQEIQSLPISSDTLGIMGKIDILRLSTKTLIERKYQLKKIYQGQLYQLWAQYFCLIEMGYQVEAIAFYEISTHKMIPMSLPTQENKQELQNFIDQFNRYDPSQSIEVNPNKCSHCIYNNLCDKTEVDNVYS